MSITWSTIIVYGKWVKSEKIDTSTREQHKYEPLCWHSCYKSLVSETSTSKLLHKLVHQQLYNVVLIANHITSSMME